VYGVGSGKIRNLALKENLNYFAVTDVGRNRHRTDGPGAGRDGVPATASDRVAAAVVGCQRAATPLPETARCQAPSGGGGAR